MNWIVSKGEEMMFIKLTRHDGKGEIYVNVSSIETFYGSGESTTIMMNESTDCFWRVTETPEEIFDMIGGG